MSLEVPPDDRKWDVTWADSSRAQLAEALSATPAQRLAWLEEAIEFAYRASQAKDTPRTMPQLSSRPVIPAESSRGTTRRRS